MSSVETQPSIGKNSKIPPRERLLATAAELFYRQGIRAVGVESIAEAAGTNKMTLYRHFSSKDELVAEYIRRVAGETLEGWQALADRFPGDPPAQLRAWVKEMVEHVASGEERGCPMANAAVELPEKDHPARRVIEEFKNRQRDYLIAMCREAKLSEPEMLADELFLLFEGAQVTAQSMGPQGLGARVLRMAETLIKSHQA
jgi:AcrR family transcriptional regulator